MMLALVADLRRMFLSSKRTMHLNLGWYVDWMDSTARQRSWHTFVTMRNVFFFLGKKEGCVLICCNKAQFDQSACCFSAAAPGCTGCWKDGAEMEKPWCRWVITDHPSAWCSAGLPCLHVLQVVLLLRIRCATLFLFVSVLTEFKHTCHIGHGLVLFW